MPLSVVSWILDVVEYLAYVYDVARRSRAANRAAAAELPASGTEDTALGSRSGGNDSI